MIFICDFRFGSDLQLTGVTFDGYGKNFAKSIKQSPDALIQVSVVS